MNNLKYIILCFVLLCTSSTAFAQKDMNAMEEALAQVLNKYSLQADTLAKHFSKKFRKDANVQVRLARSYYRNRDQEKAKEYIGKALQINSECGPAFLLEGDMAAFNVDTTSAIGFYKRAMDADPKNLDGYLRYISAVQSKKPEDAVAALETMKSFIPDYPAALVQSNIWYQNQKFDKAIELFAAMDSTKMDEETVSKYIFALYASQKHKESYDIALKAKKKYPKSVRIQRVLFYDAQELKKYKEAFNYGDSLFILAKASKKEEDKKMRTLDYTYYGMACRGVGKYDKAMLRYAEYTKDTLNSPQDIYSMKNVVKDYIKNIKAGGLYDLAARSYKLFLDNSDKPLDYDYYSVTEIYREQADEAIDLKSEQEAAYHQLDSAYVIFEREHSKWDQLDAVLYYHALYNNLIVDPNGAKGTAANLYQKVIDYEAGKTLGDREKAMLKQAYTYLAFYHFNNGRKVTGKNYAKKVLAIDKNSQNAKIILNAR